MDDIDVSLRSVESAAMKGDRDSIARLLAEYGPALARRLRPRIELNPFHDFSVEDVLQEVFLDVFRGIETYRPDQEHSFKAWLFRVADNRLVSMLRQRSRQKRGGGQKTKSFTSSPLDSSVRQLVNLLADDRAATASQNAARDEAIAAIHEQLAALPADQRDAIQARFFQQSNVDSTAKTLNKTNGAVRGLIHRAKQSLKSAMGNSSRWFNQR